MRNQVTGICSLLLGFARSLVHEMGPNRAVARRCTTDGPTVKRSSGRPKRFSGLSESEEPQSVLVVAGMRGVRRWRRLESSITWQRSGRVN